MPKRSRVTLDDVAEWDNLVQAAYRAAQGKRMQSGVRSFLEHLDANLAALRQSLLDGSLEVGRATSFRIFDPKPRTIHAPVFSERVLHHALMRHVGPVLDNSLVADTFACRVGKGGLAAVRRAQHHARRFPWFGKLDVRQYFPSICHGTLLEMLERKFKDRRLLELLARIIRSYAVEQERGLPIGALTSQNFANFYLNPLDRFLLEHARVGGLVRYMDDVAWWCESRQATRDAASAARDFLEQQLRLEIRPPIQVNRTSRGVSLCGYRVFPGTIRLSRRRRKRYQQGRRKWEARLQAGQIDARQLQIAYAAVLGITLHAEAVPWRREELRRRPPLAVCEQI